MTDTARGRAWGWGLTLAAAVAVALLELLPRDHGGGAILLTLVLWTAAAQGSVAAAAAAEITNARWVAALKPELLGAARVLPLLALLFVLLWPQLGLYGWTASPDAWFNPPFFFWRNLAVLAVVAAGGALYASRSLRGAPSSKPLAVVYLLLYTACQTLVAFDWVMSLSMPWVSSMLGMYFTVEGVYAGLALAGILFLVLRGPTPDPAWISAGRDLGLLLFGFCILWGGLFFAQFMLLWYGNLPEEVGLIARRMAASPTQQLGVGFLVGGFGVPFVALISVRAKESRATVAAVAVAVLAGLVAERLFLVLPVLPLRWGTVLAENVILLAVWWTMVSTQRRAPMTGASQGGAE